MYEITGGNYRVHRTLTYPDLPKSQIVFDTDVRAISQAEWSTKIAISGTYDGPTDIVSVKDYQLEWSSDRKSLFEKGSATLVTSSGHTIRSTWTSTYTPDKPNFERFPAGGESVKLTFTPFDIQGNRMSYKWRGTAQPAAQR